MSMVTLFLAASCEITRPRVNGKFWIPFGDLEIHETIGEGHYGKVLKANWFRTVVAIKMLKGKGTKFHGFIIGRRIFKLCKIPAEHQR